MLGKQLVQRASTAAEMSDLSRNNSSNQKLSYWQIYSTRPDGRHTNVKHPHADMQYEFGLIPSRTGRRQCRSLKSGRIDFQQQVANERMSNGIAKNTGRAVPFPLIIRYGRGPFSNWVGNKYFKHTVFAIISVQEAFNRCRLR